MKKGIPRLLCNLLCLPMRLSDTESIKSKHFYKLISLLNFDDTSDITEDFVMTVTILRTIILWTSQSWFCYDINYSISLTKTRKFCFSGNVWEIFVMLVVVAICVDVLFHLILFMSCFSTSCLLFRPSPSLSLWSIFTDIDPFYFSGTHRRENCNTFI